MTGTEAPGAAAQPPWVGRALLHSGSGRRAAARSAVQVEAFIAAARRLIGAGNPAFTTQELAREAGVALQTFYRHFAGKDQLLLAVVESAIAERVREIEERARDLPDPVGRLRFTIAGALRSVGTGTGADTARFMTAEHWRLYQLFPDEMTTANEPFAALIARDLLAAAEQGLLRPRDPAADGRLTMQLVMAVFHHHAYAGTQRDLDEIVGELWSFCAAAFGAGHPPPTKEPIE